jgi:hypothetical protein
MLRTVQQRTIKQKNLQPDDNSARHSPQAQSARMLDPPLQDPMFGCFAASEF